MHISLTPELEALVKQRVESGRYNNASEVIREALRFMVGNEELIGLMKMEALQRKLAEGARQARDGRFTEATIPDLIAEARAENA